MSSSNSLFQPKLTLNCRGQLFDLTTPAVMGIVNITPDSFYSQSRCSNETEVLKRVETIVHEGGRMVDIGAYSSRPGAAPVSQDEELARLLPALRLVRRHYPSLPVSVDTFRAAVAQRAVDGGADIVNDISGGEMDASMFDTVARLHVPYILMHMQGTPQTMQTAPAYGDLMAEIMLWFAQKVADLRNRGVNDIIIDPGFGFGKTVDHNYELLSQLNQFTVFELPLLAGVSRKSMIYRLLNIAPEQSLNGTTVLNTLALLQGANILRVHDVKEAVECVILSRKTADFNSAN